MKKDEIQKIKEKNETELHKDLESLREELRNLRNDLHSGKLKNVNALRETRKKIALILTLLNLKKGHDN